MIRLTDKKVVGILLISLAVNFFLVGVISSRLLRSGPENQPLTEPVNLQWLTGDLGAAQRQTLLPELQSMNQALRPVRLQLIREQRNVSRELMAEAMDREAITDALTALRLANENYQQVMHEHLVEVLVQMPTEQRRQVMQFMTERRPPLRRLRDGRDGPLRGEPDGTRPGERRLPPPPPPG